jgi:WD40 repeat protein
MFAGLATLAWFQSYKAKRANAEDAIKQAALLGQTDFTAGRKARGMHLLEAADNNAPDDAAVRTASAAVFALPDLVRVPAAKTKPQTAPASTAPLGTNEICRAASHNGLWTAVARDVEGLNGAVDLIQTATGARLSTIQRKEFPWVPVPEPGLLRFSPNNKLLAIGGAATSRHVLLCNVPDGTLNSYLFHGSDPLCCAWHGGGRLLAVGCEDGTIRIWNTEAAVNQRKNPLPGNQFDLPPDLDVPAQDQPAQVLHAHRGAVRNLTFSSSGEWLASLDAMGYLRIHTGFPRVAEPRLLGAGGAPDVIPEPGAPAAVFAVEVRLAEVNQVTGLEAEQDRVVVRRSTLPPEEFQFVPSEFPSELLVAPLLGEVAFNPQGTELCATTPTDVYWLRTTPLELLQRAAGENPMGASSQSQENCWLIAKDQQLTEWHPGAKGAVWPISLGSQIKLREAVAGQGTRTAMSTAGDYRVAAYCGRRIQFFKNLPPAVKGSSIIANGGEGAFHEIFWDRPGRLLGVVFELPTGSLRLEAWETSTNFPPDCRALPPAILNCQRIIPANDGRHCIARGGLRGLYLFDPANGNETPLDTSSVARQDAPLACAPDGSFLAIVADRNTVRLLALPTGKLFADLSTTRQTDFTSLTWDASNRHLAATSADGYIQLWSLGPWQDWLTRHGLQK